jgi:hypothetical protein
VIIEILNEDEGTPEVVGPPSARRWRRTALSAALPLVVGASAVGEAMSASAAPAQPVLFAPASRRVVPTPTPCPKPRGFAGASASSGTVPSVMLANHQPCNHHEGMATAFRWL